MQEESLKKAIKIITDTIYNSNINVIDKYELLLNINQFLMNYEKETKSKVLKIGEKQC